MSLEREKIKLIKWITTLTDDSTIEKIKMLKESQSGTDWWVEISDEEKASIEKGLEDINTGRVIPHSEVRKKYAKWL
jgi:predicted transcriptional regulator